MKVLAVAGMVFVLGGCNFLKTDGSRLLDPTRVIKAPDEAMAVRAILPSIGPADQADELAPNSTFPREGDWEYHDTDYVMGPGDVLNIFILDLFNEGVETSLQRQISESGYISLPLLDKRIHADGLTKEALKEGIIRAYSPDILHDATVSVTIVARRQNTFSIIGAVNRANQYSVVRRDMRLLDAVALAGGIVQSNIRYIYVIRQSPPLRLRDEQAPAREEIQRERAAPIVKAKPPAPRAEVAEEPAEGEKQAQEAPSAAQEQELDLEGMRALDEALGGLGGKTEPKPVVIPRFTDLPGAAPATGQTGARAKIKRTHEWVMDADGRLLRVPIRRKPQAPPKPMPATRQAATQPDAETTTAAATTKPSEATAETLPEIADQESETIPEDPFKWRQASRVGMARVIAIDLKKLRNGAPRMNIVIRDKDVVNVPYLQVGEFYMKGEVNRPGVYSLTGRRVTIKMAVAAAGNLSYLAWPENTILIRRVGPAEEQMIPLDLEAIFQGRADDIFLKPDDVIDVGTNARAPFLAVLRNAFRMTYGFGFIYDRNFGGERMTSQRFTRW